MQSLPEKLTEVLRQTGCASATSIKGCSNDQIQNLETSFDLKLPPVYTEFLKVMGQEAGDFEIDALWTIDNLQDARTDAERIIERTEQGEENGKYRFSLTETSFVFLCSDYNFLYFDVAEGSDPPVYLFEEGEEKPSSKLPSFSAWLEGSIAHYKKIGETKASSTSAGKKRPMIVEMNDEDEY